VPALLLALLLGSLNLACSPPPNPIVQGDRVTLLIESPDGSVPSITGDFTAWKPVPASRTAQSHWYEFETRLERDARVEYLLLFAPHDLRIDPRNPRRVASVGGEASEIVMPGAEPQPETVVGDQPPRGVLNERVFDVPEGSRKVVVYRPAQASGPLPIVYFNDGTLMIEKGGVPQILDRLVAAGRLRPIVAVFVDPASRADDYKANPAFREWFVKVMLPQIEETLPNAPSARAVIGVSRGAVAAIDLAWHHPDIFSRCGVLIPSTSPTDLTDQISRAAAKPIRFSIVAGRYDVEWLKEGQALREALDARGYAHTYREVPEGHAVQTWRAHLDDVLIGLGFGVS
jgi:enterochelin esterase family protein